MFLISYSINWPSFVVWVVLILEMLGSMCIVIAKLWRHKINLIFLIRPGFLFFYMTKKSRQKAQYLENKNSF